MPVSCISAVSCYNREDMSAVALLSFNEAPPEARLMPYIVHPSVETISPSFIKSGIPTVAENVFLKILTKQEAVAMCFYVVVATGDINFKAAIFS